MKKIFTKSLEVCVRMRVLTIINKTKFNSKEEDIK